MAQTNFNKALSLLAKFELVTNRERTLLTGQTEKINKYRKDKGVDTDDAGKDDYSLNYKMLGLLVQAKQFSTSGTSSAFSFIPAPRMSREISDEAIYNEIKKFIEKLKLSGLISGAITGELQNKNEEHKITWLWEAANYAYLMTNQEYFLLPKHFSKFITSLLDADIIDKVEYDILETRSAAGQLHRYAEVYSYLKRCLIFQLKDMVKNEDGFLKELYQRTSAIFPGLQFDSLSYKNVIDKKESSDDFIVHNLSVSIQAGKKKYSYSSYYDYESSTKKKEVNTNTDGFPSMMERIPEQYYQVFNKMMVDMLSPYRLHMLNINQDSFGVIVLTEEQAKNFNWTYDGALERYINISYEKYSKKLTSIKIADAIKLYDSIGLFASLTKKQKDSSVEELNTKEINYYTDILKTFDKTIFDIDAEYGIEGGQYKLITLELEKCSRGYFKPIDIIDTYTYENKNFEYGFTLNGKQYKINLTQEDDWLDMRFWDLIQAATNEDGSDGNFYYVYPSDGITAIYLTGEQYEILKEKKLLEFSDAEISDESE